MDKFEDTYRNWLEQYEPEPPSGIWERIEDELDIAAAWEGVQNELDISNSWGQIEKRLDSHRRKRILYIASMAASVLLFLGVLFWSTDKDYSGTVYTITGRSDSVFINEKEDLINEKASSIVPRKELAQQTLARRMKSLNAESDELPFVSQQGIVREDRSGSSFESMNKIAMVMPVYYNEEGRPGQVAVIEQQTTDAGIPAQEQGMAIGKRSRGKTSYGFQASLTNTWLMNDKTESGLQSDELVATQASYGKDFGLFVSHQLNSRWGLRLEYFFYNEVNQRYNEYYNGRYVNSAISLRYQQMDVLFEFAPFRNSSQHKMYCGLYGGYMHQANQVLGGERRSLMSEYAQFDYGVVGGYFYHLKAFSRVMPTAVGVRFTYGLPNVFEGNEMIPADFSSTRNLSFQLTLAVGLDELSF